MAGVLKIECNVCNSKAVITKSTHEHIDFKRLYCRCTNPACNHKFVMNLEHSHTTRTSDITRKLLLSNLISKLSDSDKDVIRKSL